jgi:hypothetical protein
MKNICWGSLILFTDSKSQEYNYVILGIVNKNLYISTRQVENCSGFILITKAFHV